MVDVVSPKPASKRFSSPPSLKCELCGYYTENPIAEYGGNGPRAKMKGRFCNEHLELIRRIDDASAQA
jgi:hypothetical protein